MNKLYNSQSLRKYLSVHKEYKCERCDIGSEWNNKILRLQVDHTDGNSSNNDPSNLRFLCPNCHSQTDTFTGRNARYKNFAKPSKEEFLELYKQYTVKEISILKAVSLRVVYQWFKFYVKENRPTLPKKRTFTCGQIRDIRSSKETAKVLAERYDISDRTIRDIKHTRTYRDCN